MSTMTELTPEVLAELRKLAEAATPGPWVRSENGVSQDGGVTALCAIADCSRARRYGINDQPSYDETEANAAFIAALRNATPALIAAAEERNALRREVQKEIRIGADNMADAFIARDELAEVTAERDRYKAALNRIASWGEGATVDGSFNEPASAQIAREALAND